MARNGQSTHIAGRLSSNALAAGLKTLSAISKRRIYGLSFSERRSCFGAISDDVTENTPFTPDEQNEIAARLQALAEHARRTYSLSAAQMRALDTKLDYLADAARRLGRKDWLNVCAGAILGYILSASLPPEAARDMFLGLARAIGHLWGLPDLPMLPS